MIFEDAIDEMLVGKICAREAWGDPSYFSYVVHYFIKDTPVWRVMNVQSDDSEADDWYVIGYLQ